MEFSRFELLVQDKFLKIQNLKVLVIGVGGVGGVAACSLARSGILNITLVDYDIVDITNINRQVIAFHSTIGFKKVEVLKEKIQDINPKCQVKTYDLFVDSSNIELLFENNYDYILDCSDTIKTKELLIREAVKRKIKIISSMGAGFKFNPEKIEIARLKDTSYDKIASILRHNLKDEKECLKIPVVYSKETSLIKNKIIASNSYIPNIFGLYMVSYVINDIVKEKNEKV